MKQTQEVSTTLKDNDTVPNNTNDFEYTIEEIRDLYFQAVRSRQFRSGVEKIRLDSEWTEFFHRLNGLGNSDVLSSFKLRLERDDKDEQMEIHQK